MVEEIKKVEDVGLIDKAVAAAERLEAANKVHAELLAKQEQLMAKQTLAGRAEAGTAIKQETDEEKWKREAKIRYAGTGLDPSR